MRPKLGSFEIPSLKRETEKNNFLKKNPPVPHPTRALSRFRTISHSKAQNALTAPVVLHRTRIDKCTMKAFSINRQSQNKDHCALIYCGGTVFEA
jgi:hypothetical protein